MSSESSNENITPSVMVQNDEKIYDPRDLNTPENKRRLSSGALAKVLTIETKEIQDFVAQSYEALNKALAEVYRNTKHISYIKVKESQKNGGGKTQVPAMEERNKISQAILALQEKLDTEFSKSAALAQDALADGEEFVLTHPRKIRLLITTPEAKLFTYIIELADSVIRNYTLSWISMEIDDKEKNDSISRVIGDLTRVSKMVRNRSKFFNDARLEQRERNAREQQKYATKRKQRNVTVKTKSKTTEAEVKVEEQPVEGSDGLSKEDAQAEQKAS